MPFLSLCQPCVDQHALHLRLAHSHRAVAAVAWSRAHPELVAVAYSSLNDPLAREPDGLVLVWNRFVPTRPEFELRCEAAVTAIAFSTTDPRQVRPFFRCGIAH